MSSSSTRNKRQKLTNHKRKKREGTRGKNIKNKFKNNEQHIILGGFIFALIGALNVLGFDTNIFRWSQYYMQLNYDNKIFLIGSLNILFTLIIAYFLGNRKHT